VSSAVTVGAAAFVLCHCAVNIWRAFCVHSSLRWIGQESDRDDDSIRPSILLIVPAYEEQLRLRSLANRIASLQYPGELLRVLFVTSYGEHFARRINDGVASTAEVAKEQAERINMLRREEVAAHVECPITPTSMAVQLNYGVEWASKHGWLKPNCYVGLITADAFLSKDTLTTVVKTAAHWRYLTGEMPMVLQQPSTHVRGLSRFMATFPGMVRSAAGVYQTAFVLGVELPLLRRLASTTTSRTSRSKRRWRYAPVSGHGVYIAADLLVSHGCFPTDAWCEDITLAVSYHCSGIAVVPVPCVEENESPVALPVYYNQSRTWFTGATQYRQIVQFVRQATPVVSQCALIRALIYRTWLSASWAGGPLLLNIALASLLLNVDLIAAGIAWMVWISTHSLRERQIWRMANPPRGGAFHVVRASLAGALFYMFISPLGPMASLLGRLVGVNGYKAKAIREHQDACGFASDQHMREA
jgi:cellulose synthase/poly-beta-1,6-N-acetylglucosamine synthase-like glycosyltransferase